MASSIGSDDGDSAKGKINEWQESSQVLLLFRLTLCICLVNSMAGCSLGFKKAIIFARIQLFVKMHALMHRHRSKLWLTAAQINSSNAAH